MKFKVSNFKNIMEQDVPLHLLLLLLLLSNFKIILL